MNLATIILTHTNHPLTTDTVKSIQTHVGERVLVLVDRVGWPLFQNFKVGNARVEEGFFHSHKRSPYRNCALGLKKLYEYWPDSDWFLYAEYDCLFCSGDFREDLEKAAARRAWVVGADLRRFDFELPVLEAILNQGKIGNSYYFLGCCQFLHHDFVSKMHDIGFIDNLLEQTKDFKKGFFPGYERWAFEEELWPTVAAHMGGALYELVCWKGGGEWQSSKTNDAAMVYAGAEHDQWRGRFKRFPIRNNPDIKIEEMKPETSIAHPIKDINNPIRLHQQELRKKKFLVF